MDTFGANLLGMVLGRLTLQYYESKEYDWSGKRERKKGYFFLILKQFTPLSWSQYHWEVFSSFRRFLQVNCIEGSFLSSADVFSIPDYICTRDVSDGGVKRIHSFRNLPHSERKQIQLDALSVNVFMWNSGSGRGKKKHFIVYNSYLTMICSTMSFYRIRNAGVWVKTHG